MGFLIYLTITIKKAFLLRLHNESRDCEKSAINKSQMLYFNYHKVSGKGYARYFSNKAWTDQVAIALYFRELENTAQCRTCDKPLRVLFIDVGANVGQTLRFIRDLFMRQHRRFSQGSEFVSISAEPSPTTFKELVKESELTKHIDKKSSYYVLNYGMGETVGELPFYSKGKGDQGATFNAAARQSRPVYARIRVDTVDNIITNYSSSDSYTRIIVKIDVEGFELSALMGMRNALQIRAIAVIIWEWVPEKMPIGSLKSQVNFVSQFGYEVFISTLRAFIRLDNEHWDDMYESTKKTINLAALPNGSEELENIMKIYSLCKISTLDIHTPKFNSDLQSIKDNSCLCWNGSKTSLPDDAFEVLRKDGMPMGRD